MAINYADNNPFYNKVDPIVSAELERRAGIYASRARGLKQDQYIHDWLEGKTAYVKIYYGEGAKKQLLLEPPKEGFDSIYGQYGYFPKPVVSGVRISNDGDYGSLIRAEIQFSVFTLSQLTEFSKNLLTVKSGVDNAGNPDPIPVTIEYGWTLGGNGTGDKFYGYVVDYSWTLRADGGFDCVSKLVGEGYFSLNVKADATSKKNKNTVESGNLKDLPLHWIDILKSYDFKGEQSTTGIKNNINLKVKCLAELPIGNKVRNTKEQSSDTQQKDTIKYATLEFVAAAVNSMLSKENTDNRQIFPENSFLCNSDISKSWYYSLLVSSDPKNIIFPGLVKYGPDNGDELFPPIDGISMINAEDINGVDLSKILISVDFLESTMSTLKTEDSPRMNYKDVDVSLSNFFKKIFDKIDKCSGGLYQITLSNPIPANSDQLIECAKTWIISDTLYHSVGNIKKDNHFPQIIPVIVSAPGTGTYSSIVRSLSMSSKLPGALATAQYISAASTLTGQTPVLKNVTSPTAKEDYKTATINLQKVAKAAAVNNFKDSDINNLENALLAYKTGLASDSKKGNWSKGFPIPLDLAITMDGIKGFRFGNTLKIDYLPEGYEDVVFTVTKVTHDIKNNDWQTTINTVCRLKID